jgi:hypothetical protein
VPLPSLLAHPRSPCKNAHETFITHGSDFS